VDLLKQELSLLTCIIAIIQKEELSDSRNRQAQARNDRPQNEDQIWQRLTEGGAGGGGVVDAAGHLVSKDITCCGQKRGTAATPSTGTKHPRIPGASTSRGTG
jgi:hypothetical protein